MVHHFKVKLEPNINGKLNISKFHKSVVKTATHYIQTPYVDMKVCQHGIFCKECEQRFLEEKFDQCCLNNCTGCQYCICTTKNCEGCYKCEDNIIHDPVKRLKTIMKVQLSGEFEKLNEFNINDDEMDKIWVNFCDVTDLSKKFTGPDFSITDQ